MKFSKIEIIDGEQYVKIDLLENELRENFKLQARCDRLTNNWNKLKDGLRSLYNFDEGVVSKDYLECVEDTLDKMEEIEKNGTNE